MPLEIAKAEVIARLKVYCESAGSQRAAATHLHVSGAMLSQCIHGKRAVPARILSALGIVRRRRVIVEHAYFLDSSRACK